MEGSTLDFHVHHQLLELTQTHVHHIEDAIQPSYPLMSPSPRAFNLSQYQGLFKWVSSLHRVMVESSDKMWSTGEGNGKPLQYSCLENPMTSMKRQNDSFCPTVMEKAMAAHSSTLAWKIPWTKEPGVLQSMGSLRVGHNWATSLSLFTFLHWRRKWQPTPVFLPGESQGWGSLVGWRLWGHTELDTTEVT